MHVASREAAEEIIGNVVVECYDYDEVSRCSPTGKENAPLFLHVILTSMIHGGY